jgi:mono/diheme cytochrome c family protein
MGYLAFLTPQEVEAIASELALSRVNTSPPEGALDGATLYAQYCASCHGGLANSTKRGTTAEKIKSAISWWWTDMRLLDFLTDEEIQLIADALAP